MQTSSNPLSSLGAASNQRALLASVLKQAEQNQQGIGSATVRVMNNTAEFCLSLLPFHGLPDGNLGIQLQPFNANQFFRDAFNFVPGLFGNAASVVRALQLFMMVGSAHTVNASEITNADATVSTEDFTSSSASTHSSSTAPLPAAASSNVNTSQMSTQTMLPLTAVGGVAAIGVTGFVVHSYLKAYDEGKTGWAFASAPFHEFANLFDFSCANGQKKSTMVIEAKENNQEETTTYIVPKGMSWNRRVLFELDRVGQNNDAKGAQSTRALCFNSATKETNLTVVTVDVHHHQNQAINLLGEENNGTDSDQMSVTERASSFETISSLSAE